MSRPIASALLLAVAVSGCVARDSAPRAPVAASEADEPPAPRDRVTPTGPDVARAQDEMAEEADAALHHTEWERQPVPRRFRAAVAGFRDVDGLLFSLADHLVDLRSEGAAVSVTVRVRDDGPNVLGKIVVDGYLDDSVRGHEYRASFRRDGDVWHVEELMRRQRCWRGGGPDACV